MATYTIYSDTSDGRVVSTNATYATARSGSGLTTNTTDVNSLIAGQVLSGGSYFLYEGFVQFDTSSVTGGISTVTLDLYGNTDWDGVGGWTVRARLYDWGTAIDTGDWVAGADLSGKTLLATYASSSFSTTAYNTFTSESAFATNVNQSGSTRMVISSSRFEAGSAPSAITTLGDAKDERLFFQTADTSGTDKDPKLTVVVYESQTVTADGRIAGRTTATATADAIVELGAQTLVRVLRGESGGPLVRGATSGQGYRIYNSAGTVVQSATADSNGKVTFTTTGLPVTGTVRGFTDNTYATPLSGQWCGKLIAAGNVFDAAPAAIPKTGLSVVDDSASYYYPTHQYGSRDQIVETATKRYMIYRTGGAGTAFGGTATDGSVAVVRVDKSTGKVDQGPVTIASDIEDGHHVAAIARAPNGKLRVVYGDQTTSPSLTFSLYFRESTNADDVTSWGTATSIYSNSNGTFSGNFFVDSDGKNYVVGSKLSGGPIVYGTSTNAAPSSFTFKTLVNASGTATNDWGTLFGDVVLYESGGTKKVMICWGSYKLGSTFGTTAYRHAYYMESTDDFATATKADGTSVGTLPRSTSGTDGTVSGCDQISSLYHYGYWFKIAQLSGTPYVLLDNDRNNLPAGNVPGNQVVASWNGSSWSKNTITDLPMWVENPDTSDPNDTRAIVNGNWGVNIQSRGTSVFVYGCIGNSTLPSLDSGHDGFRLVRFESTDGFASYWKTDMISEAYGSFTYTDLDDGTRSSIVFGAGFCYPKVPDDPATVMFGIVDRDYSTVVTTTLTVGRVTADALIVDRKTASVTADALITTTATATVAADALIAGRSTSAVTADAVVQQTATASLTGDALVIGTNTATVTADAVVQQAVTQTVTGDATVAARGTASALADALVLGTVTQTVTADALVGTDTTLFVSADALVRGTATSTTFADALIAARSSATVTGDAQLVARTTDTVTADAVLASRELAATDADGVVTQRAIVTATADAVVEAGFVVRTAILTADALVGGTFTAVATADAIVNSTGGPYYLAGGPTPAVSASGASTLPVRVTGDSSGSVSVTGGPNP